MQDFVHQQYHQSIAKPTLPAEYETRRRFGAQGQGPLAALAFKVWRGSRSRLFGALHVGVHVRSLQFRDLRSRGSALFRKGFQTV